ncbi:MAG: hypothetical protein NTW21_32205 [Verrucomicrobia bacterium]|nr:hypothetical protein [Verrucomicrobiota bacterium]
MLIIDADQSFGENGLAVEVGLAAWRASSLALMKFREGDDAGAVARCERSLGYRIPIASLSASVPYNPNHLKVRSTFITTAPPVGGNVGGPRPCRPTCHLPGNFRN